ncbi:hypothetical protein RJ55_04268 [Drechmeria coniospora]|nr:hypothetical protein RJ55_04268 [Drechmeria coniospora]
MPQVRRRSSRGATTSDSDTSSSSGDDEKEAAVYREVKICRNGHHGDNLYLEDEGSDSFLKQFASDGPRHAPITYRRVFSKTGSPLRTVLKIHSPVLIEALKETIAVSRSESYQRLFSRKVNLRKPFIMLFQNRRRLMQAADQAEGEKAIHLRLLLKFLQEEMAATWTKLDEIEEGKCRRISFEDSWLLYPPGTTVYVRDAGLWRAYKVDDVWVNHLPIPGLLHMRSYYLCLDDSASRLEPVEAVQYMTPFSGERFVSDFGLIPESHVEGRREMDDFLEARGRTFWGFHGEPAYRQYVGAAWPTTRPSDYVRVIIDYVTASRYPAESTDDYSDSDDEEYCSCSACVRKYARLTSSYPEDALGESNICMKDRWSRSNQTDEPSGQGTRQSPLMFSPCRVWAFSLKHKSWKHVELDNLEPIAVTVDPFSRLVIEDNYKEVIESMVDAYLSNAQFYDIIKGKGRGLIVLLHGGPGTGKTLTAECVAEKKMRPLYMVTCGDLGTDPDKLEMRLQETFIHAVHWKAILLLDEADVFLQERDLYDLKRNALVSVFLRHIEYYDGLLFLTTNRPGQIDEAFHSRIHITLGLPDLDFERQKQVWLIFVRNLRLDENDEANRAKKVELLKFVQQQLESKLREIKGFHMNGRQIRNCIRAAAAIANRKGRSLQKEDIVAVVDLGMQFRVYMTRVNRMSQDERAMALGLRLQHEMEDQDAASR